LIFYLFIFSYYSVIYIYTIMAASVTSSPIRSAGTAGSPGFRSQRKLSAETIVKKIQTLEDAIQSLRQQLVFTRSEEDVCPGPQKEVKKPKEIKQQKETKETKQKKTQESKEEKIPMPWTGQVDFAACVGLKAQYGLFIQCAKTCDMKTASFQIDNHECRFCSDCSKKCDENGKHPVGTIEERIESGVGKYVNAKTGKRETIYIEVLEKMKITKEQALESAQRRGFQIPDWMLEKAEKKRGRPAATVAAATVGATAAAALANDTGNDETKSNETKNTKEKKPRQPRAKATTNAATTKAATTKKTTKASAATQDTPQKKNSAQSSICIDLNNDDESVTPVADAASVASVASAPQENEKKKRGRPTKSNTQNNIGESEMQQLIVQATTEKKKRLSLDAAVADAHTSEEGVQVETHLTFEENENGNEQEQLGEDEIFEMFDKMLENEDEKKQQEQQEQQGQQELVVTVATKEKKGKSEKKAKKSNDKEKVEKEKISKKEAAALKKAQEEEAALKKAQEEEAALKKAQEEAAALKKAQEEAALKKAQEEEEDDNETVDEEEEESNEEEEEELECEEYEYDGETYGLAPNGDIYSQDGDLVGKLTNGVPNMFN